MEDDVPNEPEKAIHAVTRRPSVSGLYLSRKAKTPSIRANMTLCQVLRARVHHPDWRPRPRHSLSAGLLGPSLLRIMTTGSPSDSVVIRSKSWAEHAGRCVTSPKAPFSLSVWALSHSETYRCPANCNYSVDKHLPEDPEQADNPEG